MGPVWGQNIVAALEPVITTPPLAESPRGGGAGGEVFLRFGSELARAESTRCRDPGCPRRIWRRRRGEFHSRVRR